MADKLNKPADGSNGRASSAKEDTPTTAPKPVDPLASAVEGPASPGETHKTNVNSNIDFTTAANDPVTGAAVTLSQSSADMAPQKTAADAGPILPLRDYPRDQRYLTYPAPRFSQLPPSRALPRFLTFLAWFIFVGGSTATIIAVLYQRYVLPKLLLTSRAILSLHLHAIPQHEKLLSGVVQLVMGDNYFTKRENRLSEAVLQNGDNDGEGQMQIISDPTAERNVLDSATAKVEADKEALITLPLQQSLKRLESALIRPAAAPVNSLLEPSSSRRLLSSLELLTTRLTNETIYSSTPSFSAAAYGYNYGGSANKMPNRGGADIEKIAAVKSELRSLKGTLLTRRNFAVPSRAEGEA